MKIAVDARLLERKMTGIGRLLAGFLDNILKLDKDNEYFLFFKKIQCQKITKQMR